MKFYGELLIFILLLATNLRVFFVSHVKRDPLVSVAPLTLILSILQIISWGLDVFTLAGLIIALLVFFSNFHAMFRYSEQLYIDHYSPLMKIWAVFTVLLSAIALAALIFFAPVEQNNEKIGVSEKITRYEGTFRSGFEQTHFFCVADGILHEFSQSAPLGEEAPEPKALILFFPDKRGDTVNYKPYLQQLAKKGYLVYSADFYADDLRWLHSFEDIKILRREASVIRSLANPKWYMSQREYYSFNISMECQAVVQMVNENLGADKKFYLITDIMGNTAIEDYAKKNGDRVSGTFNLDSISDYKTSGYGCIEQTDPLLADYLGYKRDPSLTTPKLLADKTEEFINDTKSAL